MLLNVGLCNGNMNEAFTYLEQFIDHIDVVCPQCEARACVKSNPKNRQQTKCTCLHCGYAKTWKEGSMLLGEPVDCYFQLPLWFVDRVKGHALFAYNFDHLTYLENFVASKLRERRPDEFGWSNQSLESRMPKWLQSATNRALILRKLEALRTRAREH